MTDTQVYEKLLQIRACADLRTAEMLEDLISEFESRERSKKAPSKSVAALVKAFPASWKRHMKDNALSALRLQKALRWTGSRSVTLYRQTGSGSALKPLRGTTESGDLLVICPIRCAA